MHAVAFDAAVVNVRLPVSVLKDQNDLLISFPSVVGQTYRLEQTGSLNGSWTVALNNIQGTGATITLRVTSALLQSAAFYRVVALYLCSGEHRLPACGIRPLCRMHLRSPSHREIFAASRREQQASGLCSPEKFHAPLVFA